MFRKVWVRLSANKRINSKAPCPHFFKHLLPLAPLNHIVKHPKHLYYVFMDNNQLLQEIEKLLDRKLEEKLEEKLDQKFDEKLKPIKRELRDIKERLENVEMKVELVNKRVEQAQEETIETLTELMTTSYTNHEKRIKRIEAHLDLPTQKN